MLTYNGYFLIYSVLTAKTWYMCKEFYPIFMKAVNVIIDITDINMFFIYLIIEALCDKVMVPFITVSMVIFRVYLNIEF